MPEKDLGKKFSCFKCGTKFYDLKKPQVVCPKCGADQKDSPAKASPAAERRRPAPRPVEPIVEEAEVEAELDEDEEAEADEPAEEDEP